MSSCYDDWLFVVLFFFFKQKTAYEMRISDWSSDVCSSDLHGGGPRHLFGGRALAAAARCAGGGGKQKDGAARRPRPIVAAAVAARRRGGGGHDIPGGL